MAVTHGNDPDRLDAIGDALRAEGDRVEEVLGSGTSGIAVLVGAWSGPDLEGFVGDWQGAQAKLQAVTTTVGKTGDGEAAGLLDRSVLLADAVTSCDRPVCR